MGSVVVTHPFHPLAGRRVEVLFAKRRAGGVVFVCDAGAAGQVTLLEGWTDRGPAGQPGRLSVEGLAEPDTLIGALRGR